jgi:hypothetical protein
MTRNVFHPTATVFTFFILGLGLPSSASAQTAATDAAAASNQTCIAIVLPSATGIDGDATAFASSLRDLFASYLTGPTLRTITVDARLASQATEEARQKNCNYVLLTSINRKRNDGSGLGRALGRAAGTAAWHGVPYAGAGTAAARGAAIAGAEAISSMAQATKSKDEVTLEYRIGTVDTVTRAQAKTEKAKAKQDGEDVLTPLVEKASESIATAVLRR